MRATWLTDIHLNFLGNKALSDFYKTLRRERPDVLFVTGDIGEADSVFRYVADLGKVATVYYVLGNHDYYQSSIARVRATAVRGWLAVMPPVQLTEHSVVLGVDGWGDARCGNLDSPVALSDWHLIDELRIADAASRIEKLQELGAAERDALRDLLAQAPESDDLYVLTHVPPFAEACFYDGKMSSPDWLPWFTCIGTGEPLLEHARAHPRTRITVLCGHTHGQGQYRAAENLVVLNGGWPHGVEGYGNPIIQATFELR